MATISQDQIEHARSRLLTACLILDDAIAEARKRGLTEYPLGTSALAQARHEIAAADQYLETRGAH